MHLVVTQLMTHAFGGYSIDDSCTQEKVEALMKVAEESQNAKCGYIHMYMFPV